MEWSGQQQIQRLLQSVLLGAVQGFLLDGITGCVGVRAHRKWLWSDVLFGPLAGIITFFGALVIMDGQLHPILLIGVFSGMLIEHVTVGTMVRYMLRSIRRCMVRCAELGKCTARRLALGMRRCFDFCRRQKGKMPKYPEKQQKMS